MVLHERNSVKSAGPQESSSENKLSYSMIDKHFMLLILESINDASPSKNSDCDAVGMCERQPQKKFSLGNDFLLMFQSIDEPKLI